MSQKTSAYKYNHVTENDIENYLISECEKRDWLCYKFVSPSRDGVPDRIVIGRTIRSQGFTVFVELKAPQEKPRALQRHILADMQNAGAHVFVIDTTESVDVLITNLLKGGPSSCPIYQHHIPTSATKARIRKLNRPSSAPPLS